MIPKLGRFISHNGSEGVAFQDEHGGCWMRFEDGKMDMIYDLNYVREWLDDEQPSDAPE